MWDWLFSITNSKVRFSTVKTYLAISVKTYLIGKRSLAVNPNNETGNIWEIRMQLTSSTLDYTVNWNEEERHMCGSETIKQGEVKHIIVDV